MAVIITVEVQGQTQAGYDGMLALLAERARAAPGFILHGAYPSAAGWRVVEFWASRVDADRFFTHSVVPQLPPGVRPKRSVQELHSLLR